MCQSDLHVHTVFSDGINTMEEMVRAAMDRGFASIGISDHSYTPHDLRYCIREERLPAYHAELERLKAVYRDRIKVYTSLEWDSCTELHDRHFYDYLIGDCHYVKTRDGLRSVDHAKEEQRETIEMYFGGDGIAFAKAYFEMYTEGICRQKPDILGHFDLPVKFGLVDETDPVYRAAAAEALRACLEVTPIVELNTGAVARGVRKTPYPARFLLEEILRHGGKITLSSDAHRADMLGFGFAEARELLRAVGFDSMVTFRDGRFRECGL